MLHTRTSLWRKAIVVVALTAAAAAGGVSPAWAAGPAAGPGHDVSHPQCGGVLPESSTFGIVGLNQGRPFSTNPCLNAQYQWAAGRPAGAAIYVNTGNPAPSSDYYWPLSGSSDPALCRDSSSTKDPGCAYDYGWHAAKDALATGRKLGQGVLGHTWWLDVETANTWNGDGVSNTALLQGMYDYLRSHGVGKVGLYSTGYQWKRITGGYGASSAATYVAAWQPHVVPDFPLHDAPLWIASGGGATSGKCTTSFTGGPTTMVQFVTDGFDTNIVC